MTTSYYLYDDMKSPAFITILTSSHVGTLHRVTLWDTLPRPMVSEGNHIKLMEGERVKITREVAVSFVRLLCRYGVEQHWKTFDTDGDFYYTVDAEEGPMLISIRSFIDDFEERWRIDRLSKFGYSMNNYLLERPEISENSRIERRKVRIRFNDISQTIVDCTT